MWMNVHHHPAEMVQLVLMKRISSTVRACLDTRTTFAKQVNIGNFAQCNSS